MKQIVVLAIFLVFSVRVFAQEPLLPDGQYVIVTYDKDAAHVQKCEITTNKGGRFLKIIPSSDGDWTPKPVSVFVDGDHFQFAFGPGDYPPEVANKMEAGTTTYVGKLFDRQLIGVETHSGWEPRTSKFLLHKL